MSEQETIMKKKKKQEEKKLTVTEAIAILKPFVVKWKRQDEDMANKMYEIYKQCEWGDWTKVLDALNFPSRTWYDWAQHFGFEVNFPQTTENWDEKHAESQASEDETSEQQDIINPEVELDVEQQSNTDLYHQVSSTLSGYKKLSVKMFDLPEKDKLIEMLQNAIKKLNGLLLKLESNIDDD